LKAVIVECKLPRVPSRVDEALIMAKTIDYTVVKTLIQKRNSEHHSYCIGPGKLEELANLVNNNGVELVIFTNTLPSSQIFKIQRRLGGNIKVIDRNLLILEVFEKRAMTREAKLQIKLAKLRYTFSWGREFIKLRGIMGEQLGWMGPGDYPFQEYYRAARKRISRLEAELNEIDTKKNMRREHRHELGFPIIALAGYTQSGKTTLFNRLAGESKSMGLGPFTTLSTFARKVSHQGIQFILVDSIGFIEDMHPIILKAFNATLSEITKADVILLVVDASDDIETMSRKLASIDKILHEIDVSSDLLICLNKTDLSSQEHLIEAREVLQNIFAEKKIVQISAKTGDGIDGLLTLLAEKLKCQLREVQVSGQRTTY
jgi:GTP-binding protein HflX